MKSNLSGGCPPLLRWAGSKRATAGILASYWQPNFSTYIEPFCGSAALFFKVAPEQAVLGDINSELISFYEIVAADPVKVYRAFSKYPRNRETYYRLRESYRVTRSPIARTAIFYYLNKNCFNGLYRTNKLGHFNVPFSDNRVGRYPSEDEFLESCNLISRATFVRGDFVDVVKSAVKPQAFVFLDPPYASSARLPFREYYPNSFSVDDIDRLDSLLNHVDRTGARFLLTYANNRAINLIAKKWTSVRSRVRRNISGFSESRRMATEQMITNIREAT
jgi:DNA adenine methylase